MLNLGWKVIDFAHSRPWFYHKDGVYYAFNLVKYHDVLKYIFRNQSS